MDINQQLTTLTEETLCFASAIDEGDADDLDLLNACTLFSQYLRSELQHIDEELEVASSLRQLNTCQQLHRLHHLITPHNERHTSVSSQASPWKSQLDNFMLEVEILRQNAA